MSILKYWIGLMLGHAEAMLAFVLHLMPPVRTLKTMTIGAAQRGHTPMSITQSAYEMTFTIQG